MRTIVIFSTLFILCNLSLRSIAYGKTSPAINHTHPNPAHKINVPPPVLRSFQNLLQEIADDNKISLSNLSYFTTAWDKDKNTYTVHAEFGIGLCEEGGLTYTILARFKANGDIILIPDLNTKPLRYILGVITCIRLPI